MDIYYEKMGTGYPLVFLHGNGEDHRIFMDAADILKTDYQCILVDSRYHGQSVHSGELSYRQMAQDIFELMTQLEIEAYDVIGFSDGGNTALLLGLMDVRLKHVVCIGANTSPRMIKPLYRLGMWIKCFCLLPFCLYNKKAQQTLKLTKLMLTEPHIENDELQKMSVPTLVLAGEYDMIKTTGTQAIGEAIPYSFVKIIPHGNHFLLRESFSQTMHEIVLFLSACHQED